MTTLPPDEALFRAEAKVIQRSAGRSAVAAAAYRAAACLTDERTGQAFDYTKKHCVSATILAPEGAPAWVYDRSELWNRCEAAAPRRDSVTAREMLVSIPRDIPESQFAVLAEEICRPYIAAGAVCDVALHAPDATDGEPNFHFHILMSPRRLEPSAPAGFTKKVNADLVRIFESGGQYGGKKGEALIQERARIAGVMNHFLARAGSHRRASHLSRNERGLEGDPEPKIGEQRMRKVRRQKRHDRLTAAVGGQRAARKAENQLRILEEEIMAMNPIHQIALGIRPKHKQDFKARLLSQHLPDADLSAFRDDIYQVDARSGRLVVRFRDKSWMEKEGRRIWTYGAKQGEGRASVLANVLHIASHVDRVDHLEETASCQRRGSGLRQRRQLNEALPEQVLSVLEARAEFWRALGYTHVSAQPDGCWISIGACRLQDLGDELRVHGRVTDDAARGMVLKAQEQWGGQMEVFGSKAFKDQMWLESQRQGVSLFDADTGRLYEPSPDIRRSWDEATAKLAAATGDLEALETRKQLGSLMRRAASGDVEAAVELERNDMELADFLNRHLDKHQRAEFAQGSDGEIAEDMDLWRKLGAEARTEDEQDGKADETPALSQRLAAEAKARAKRDRDHDNRPEMTPA